MTTLSSRFAACVALVLPLCAPAADLTLEISGLDTTRLSGSALMLGVFTQPGQWLSQPALTHRIALGAEHAGGTVTVVLKDVPEGSLAVSAFQDTNGNGKLDANAIGIPTEPYGFSNDATAAFGPPKFEQALFKPAGAPVRMKLN